MPEKLPETIMNLIGSTLIILILITVVILALFINQKRKFRHRQQLDVLKSQFEKEILKAQLEIQTETLESVSKELHDNVSNTISLALLNLNLLQQDDNTNTNPQILEAKQLMLEAKNAVKDYSWHINPSNLALQGLSVSLQELTEKFKKINTTRFTFTKSGSEFTIDSSRHIIIYRIVQEALSNIVKHSRCSEVKLTIDFNKPDLQININDNGIGFDYLLLTNNKLVKKNSGISNMIARSAMINAELKINTACNAGTNIQLHYKENNPTGTPP